MSINPFVVMVDAYLPDRNSVVALPQHSSTSRPMTRELSIDDNLDYGDSQACLVVGVRKGKAEESEYAR